MHVLFLSDTSTIYHLPSTLSSISSSFSSPHPLELLSFSVMYLFSPPSILPSSYSCFTDILSFWIFPSRTSHLILLISPPPPRSTFRFTSLCSFRRSHRSHRFSRSVPSRTPLHLRPPSSLYSLSPFQTSRYMTVLFAFIIPILPFFSSASI
jgi:hypothetical protein